MVGVEVDAAVAKLAVVQTDLLRALAGGLLDACNLLAFLFVGLDLCLQHADGLRVLVQVIVQMALQDVEDVRLQEGAVVGTIWVVGCQMGGAELGLGLCLKDGFLDADTQGAHQALSDVGGLIFLLVELAHHASITFAEGRLVCAAFSRVLTVDKGIEVVARLPVDMRESGLEVAIFDMDDGVEAFAFHVVLQQVEEAILGVIAFVVVNQTQTTVEVSIVPDALLDVFIHIVVITEQSGVGDELGQCASVAIRRDDA